jgi:hypothetical protein
VVVENAGVDSRFREGSAAEGLLNDSKGSAFLLLLLLVVVVARFIVVGVVVVG